MNVLSPVPWQSSSELEPALGLVCITASTQVRYRTITRKRLLQLPILEQEQALRNLYRENLNRLDGALTFCASEQIRLYRLSSALFPFADQAMGQAILVELADELRKVGTRSTELGIRLVLHPDQFVVLNSDRPEVIQTSIKILETHAQVFDALGMPRSPWSLMNIHGGKGDRAKRLISIIRDLPDAIRLRLTLENDEYTYSSEDIFNICQAAGIAMVFDAHHHVIHEHVDSYEHPLVSTALAAARMTWSVPEWQLVHISNGRDSFADPQHSDYINVMPSVYRNVAWIEVEAKLKELAIAQLRQAWLGQFHPVPRLEPIA